MVQARDRSPSPAPRLSAEDAEFLRTVEDDTEEAPWMVMGTTQYWSAGDLAYSLRLHAEREGLAWFVAAMLPILYRRPGTRRKGQVAPDVLVSFVEDRPRLSYDLEAEGVAPAFVLEVLSPSSVVQDTQKKTRTYRLLGMQEYALFSPYRTVHEPVLQGYRRTTEGQFTRWTADEQGRLWSAVLGLYLLVTEQDGELGVQAMRPDGTVLRTPRQEADERIRAETARQRAEAELARLRAEIERLRQHE
jgi:hypothetical protein